MENSRYITAVVITLFLRAIVLPRFNLSSHILSPPLFYVLICRVSFCKTDDIKIYLNCHFLHLQCFLQVNCVYSRSKLLFSAFLFLLIANCNNLKATTIVYVLSFILSYNFLWHLLASQISKVIRITSFHI